MIEGQSLTIMAKIIFGFETKGKMIGSIEGEKSEEKREREMRKREKMERRKIMEMRSKSVEKLSD